MEVRLEGAITTTLFKYCQRQMQKKDFSSKQDNDNKSTISCPENLIEEKACFIVRFCKAIRGKES